MITRLGGAMIRRLGEALADFGGQAGAYDGDKDQEAENGSHGPSPNFRRASHHRRAQIIANIPATREVCRIEVHGSLSGSLKF
jgi:hypothetical protein